MTFEPQSVPRGLYQILKSSALQHARTEEVFGALREAGFTGSASEIARLRSFAVGYRDAVERESVPRNLGVRPAADDIADSPFRLPRRYLQTVQVTGLSSMTAERRTYFISISTDRLITRGDAIDQALTLASLGQEETALTNLDGSYIATERSA